MRLLDDPPIVALDYLGGAFAPPDHPWRYDLNDRINVKGT